MEYARTCTAHTRGLICWHKALVAATPGEKGRWNRAKAPPRCSACASPALATGGDICHGCTLATVDAHIAPSTRAEVAEKARIMAEITRELIASVLATINPLEETFL